MQIDWMNNNQLYQGDNLCVLRKCINDESVDLVYLDPPFNSSKRHQLNTGGKEHNSSVAYGDAWHWNDRSEIEFEYGLKQGYRPLSEVLEAFSIILKFGSRLAYLTMMAVRLFELRRILKATGSIYLHCDQRTSAHLRILTDAIFGIDNYLNHIVWCYGLGGSSHRLWPRKHDDILWYSRTPGTHYFKPEMIPATSQMMKGQLKKAPDYWYIPAINNMAKERTGYPTQKPIELLERIVRSSCPVGGLVLDPFCGSGTTLIAAQKLGRKWIGIDSSPVAIEHTVKRLSFGAPQEVCKVIELNEELSK